MSIFLIRKIVFSFFVAAVFGAVTVYGEPEVYDAFKFEKNISYDIYFSGYGECLSAMKDVEILGFEDISGERYLVISPAGFNFSKKEGYIHFSSVRAILPSQNYKIQSGGKIKVY